MKIAVIGYSGSGKSTLAKFLSERYQMPVLYLDTVHWLPEWKERTKEDERAIVESFLNTNESWVIDGNYRRVLFERRMEEADEIVFMNFNRFSCLHRAFKRKKEYKNKNRFSMAEGCPERIGWEFFTWLIWTGRLKRRKKKFQRIKEVYAFKLTELKNQRQLNAYMQKVKNAEPLENKG